jgi:sugar/nucleoside kinase (ribokinase family)
MYTYRGQWYVCPCSSKSSCCALPYREECQAAAVRLQEKGVGDIVLTLGAEGVRYYRKGSAQASDIFVPGVKVCHSMALL